MCKKPVKIMSKRRSKKVIMETQMIKEDNPDPFIVCFLLNTVTALRSKMKQKALKACDHYTSRYAECSSGRTLSVVWQCRKQAKELNQCLHQYTNDSVLEEMKKEYALHQNLKGSLS